MRPGRELDTRIAQEVFGHKVWPRGKVLHENPETGDRPLRHYSKEIEWAAKVAEKMKITLIPIKDDQWFAFVGPAENMGWESPQAILKFLESNQFDSCGAALGAELALVICQAALQAIEKRKPQLHALANVIPEENSSPLH